MGIRLCEVEDCSECPLYINEICKGGIANYGNGPVEPPCCGMDEDEDLDEWVKDYFVREAAYEKRESERIQKKKKEDKKKELKKARRRFSDSYCRKEISELKEAKGCVKMMEKRIEDIKTGTDVLAALNGLLCKTGADFTVGCHVPDDTVAEMEKRLSEQKETVETKRQALLEKRKEAQKTEIFKNMLM